MNLSRQQKRPSPEREPVDAWVASWARRDAWTVHELAFLCLGWNPSQHQIPNRNNYNEAVDSINRAVRVRALKTIDQLAWPATRGERMYDSVPAFAPREAGAWAVTRYPTFPCRWPGPAEKPLETRERNNLYRIIAALNLKHPKDAAVIARLTIENGHEVSERSIRDHLEKIDALYQRPERHAGTGELATLVEKQHLPKK
jgi:hypothetical protein